MNHNKPIIIRALYGSLVTVSVIVVIVIASNYSNKGIAATEVKTDRVVGTAVGEVAPELISSTLEGDIFKLNNLRGQLVIINLFASWCGPCRLETPHLVEAYHEMKFQDATILGLNLNESSEAVTFFQKEFNIPYPLVMDPSGEITSELYRPIGLPTTWFIDQDGVVRYVFSGAITKKVLLQIIADVQAGREPKPFAQSSNPSQTIIR